MLKFLTKADLWQAIDEGYVPTKPTQYHLKFAQDVMALRVVGKNSGRTIGEIGADHSRVLPDLAQLGNKCYAIDIYDRSIGGGKTSKPADTNYELLNCLIGDPSSNIIPDNFFDITFSVSVLEHLTDFKSFFLDNVRITKSGGLIVHMIDIYLNDFGIAFQPTLAHACCDFFADQAVRPLAQEVISFNQFVFSTRYATNGDDMMYLWNKQVPSLKRHREESSVCCLMLAAVVE